jgi:ribosome-associated protein
LERVEVRGEITLSQFLKLSGAVSTGGQAKAAVAEGEVSVNGNVESRRGRKLVPGDRISLYGRTYLLVAPAEI